MEWRHLSLQPTVLVVLYSGFNRYISYYFTLHIAKGIVF